MVKRERTRRIIINVLIACMMLVLTSCATNNSKSIVVSTEISADSTTEETEQAELIQLETEKRMSYPQTIVFRDVKGGEHQVDFHENWQLHEYSLEAFETDMNGKMSYSDVDYEYQLGIDVSKYDQKIDWRRVKEEGYTFVFIRLGYRGYGRSGQLVEDPYAISNLKEAKEAGFQIGAYFFSQAINEKEAREEAAFAIQIIEKAGLNKDDLSLPIAFDPETIENDTARTDQVTGEQFTKNALAFIEVVQAKGYQGMIYSNMLWEAYKWDLEVLKDIPIWYADCENKPQTPYQFMIWQYSEKARVQGINGEADVNIMLKRKQ